MAYAESDCEVKILSLTDALGFLAKAVPSDLRLDLLEDGYDVGTVQEPCSFRSHCRVMPNGKYC